LNQLELIHVSYVPIVLMEKNKVLNNKQEGWPSCLFCLNDFPLDLHL